ncbi:hypothetical protein HZS_3779 [Henneguya salminicola]|nr:hypothetical protein HZS_3779 [Henneguya salminicola]
MKTNNIFEEFLSAPYRPRTCFESIQNNTLKDYRSTAILSILSPRHIISETIRPLKPNNSSILPEYNTLQRNI